MTRRGRARALALKKAAARSRNSWRITRRGSDPRENRVLDRLRLVLYLLVRSERLSKPGKSSNASAQRLHIRHSRRWNGAGRDRARHRSFDRRDLCNVSRMDFTLSGYQRVDTGSRWPWDICSLSRLAWANGVLGLLSRNSRSVRNFGHGRRLLMASRVSFSCHCMWCTCPPAPPALPGLAAAPSSACRRRSCF